MIINTSNAFLVIKTINKLEMKKDIMTAYAKITKINKDMKENDIKLRDLVLKENEDYFSLEEKEQEEINIKVLKNNIKLGKSISDLQTEQEQCGLDLLFAFLEKLPKAEKEVYSTLAKIYDKEAAEIEKQDIDKTIEMIKEIAKSESIQKLFTLAAK